MKAINYFFLFLMIITFSCNTNYEEKYNETLLLKNKERTELCLPIIGKLTNIEYNESLNQKFEVKVSDRFNNIPLRRTIYLNDENIVSESILLNGINKLGHKYKLAFDIFYESMSLRITYWDESTESSKEIIYKNGEMFYIFTSEKFQLLSSSDSNNIILNNIVNCEGYNKANNEEIRRKEILGNHKFQTDKNK